MNTDPKTCALDGCDVTFTAHPRQMYHSRACQNRARTIRQTARRHQQAEAEQRADDPHARRLAHLLDCQERGVKPDSLPTSIQLTRAAS